MIDRGVISLRAFFRGVIFRRGMGWGNFSRGIFQVCTFPGAIFSRTLFPKGFHMYVLFQKQLPGGVSMKRYSANMQQNYKRAPMPKCDYSNVALQLYWNHVSEWVFFCKVHEYFQKTFSNKRLRMAASDISVTNWNSRNNHIVVFY